MVSRRVCAGQRMNINHSVEVFLGNPISVASEQQFLARLIGDLRARGVRAHSCEP